MLKLFWHNFTSRPRTMHIVAGSDMVMEASDR